jgi:hypothetical protein
MNTKTKRGRKQDARLININEPYEIEHIIEQMAQEGIEITQDAVLDLCAEQGHNTHETIYRTIRENVGFGTLLNKSIPQSIKDAVEGLVYTSEGDFPIVPVIFKHFNGVKTVTKAAGRRMGTKAQIVTDEHFFAAKGLDGLRKVLEQELSDITVYRIGEIQIDVFVIGSLADGTYAGVKTKLIET